MLSWGGDYKMQTCKYMNIKLYWKENVKKSHTLFTTPTNYYKEHVA